MGEFVATHAVPQGGTRAWRDPDPTQAPEATLDASLPVQILEMQPNGWAHVLCSNGWSAWVDGRALQPLTAPTAATASRWGLLFEPLTVGPVAYLGAAAAVLGGLLPWLSAGSISINAWDISIVALLRGQGSGDGLKTGLVLLVVGLVALPLVTKRPLPAIAVAALAGIANNTALLLWLQNRKGSVHADIGVGLVLTFLGGSAILVDFALSFSRAHRPVTV